MNLKDSLLVTKGRFQAFLIDDKTKEKKLVFDDKNQIQYFGAHLLAYSLGNQNTSFRTPTLRAIKRGALQSSAPTQAPKIDNTSSNIGRPFTYDAEGLSFVAEYTSVPISSDTSTLLTSEVSRQAIVCKAIFPGLTNSSSKIYEFGLILDPHSYSQWSSYFTSLGITSKIDSTNWEYSASNILSGICLAYKYVSGGMFWGTGTSLEVIWTVYLGA